MYVTKMNLYQLLSKKEGSVLIIMVVTMVLLGTIGVIISQLMVGSQESISRDIDTNRAIYLAQGGVNYAGKFLKGISDWGALSGTLTKSLQGGTFAIQWGAYNAGPPNQLTVIVTGSSGSAPRQITTIFQKTGSALAIMSKGGVDIKTGSWLDCDPSDPSNPLCTGGTCACTQTRASSTDMPIVWFSSAPPVLPIPCNFKGNATYTIPAGVYYCSGGILWDGAINITLGGTVTIFTKGFQMDHGANVNASGNAANLLVISNDLVRIHHPSLFKGAIYSPGYDIRIDNQGMVTGRLAGGTTSNSGVIIETDSYMNCDSNAGSNSPYFSQTGLGSPGCCIKKV